jgi:hypothetical protein
VYSTIIKRAHRNGTSAVDFIARAITAHLIDDRGETVRPRIASDEHWVHQSALLFLRLKPVGRTPIKERRKRPPLGDKPNVGVGVRVFTHARVTEKLGRLSRLAASHIRRQHQPPNEITP